MPKRLTTEEWVRRAREKHGDKYDYSLSVYTKAHDKIKIICPEHGIFEQIAYAHTNQGSGCIRCAKKHQHTTEEWIIQAREIHGDRYDYSKSVYTGIRDKVTIICPKHGEFNKIAQEHILCKSGCKLCSNEEKSKRMAFTTNDWVTKAKEVHGDKYGYEKVRYTGDRNKVIIFCNHHQEYFCQGAGSHTSGQGCPECAKEDQADKRRKDLDWFVENAQAAHGDRYDYSKAVYLGTKEKIEIICPNPKHGSFWQTAYSHMVGHGCSKCVKNVSEGEQEVANWIRALGFEVQQSRRDLIGGKELDIFLPDQMLAIEYCGLHWHSDTHKSDTNYHKEKWQAAKEEGIDLITLYEDEWHFNKNKVKAAIESRLELRSKGEPARKCRVVQVNNQMAKEFLNRWHLQGGYKNMKVNLGLIDQNEDLVALMSFSQPSRGKNSLYEWELRRFVTDGKTHAGAASKLFKAFVRSHPEVEAIGSLSDNRWFTGSMYEALGFTHHGDVPADYEYVRGWERSHKSRFTRAGIKSKLPHVWDPESTERKMMVEAGYARIYDCGKKRWLWTRGA